MTDTGNQFVYFPVDGGKQFDYYPPIDPPDARTPPMPTPQPRYTEDAIYDACAKVERSIATLAALRTGIAGALPIAEAESLMDDVEDYLDILKVKFARALDVFHAAIERIEREDEAPDADEIAASRADWLRGQRDDYDPAFDICDELAANDNASAIGAA
jgi:hypothetical protein